MTPILSVLMPAYKAEKTIYSSAMSALRSMPANAELLVFIDGGGDGTLAELSRIKDSRLKVHVSPVNVGVVKARQFLFEWAQGEYVATLDSDDIAMPWRFKSQLRTIRRTNADFVFGNAILFGEGLGGAKFRPEWPVRLSPRLSKVALSFTNPFINSAMLAKKASIESIGGFKGAIEDLGMWLEAAAVGLKIVRTAAYAVAYRVHPTQLSRTSAWQNSLESDPLLNQIRKQYIDSTEGPLKAIGVNDPRFQLWKEYALGSFGLMMQNIGIKDYLRYRLTGVLRDQDRNYRQTRSNSNA